MKVAFVWHVASMMFAVALSLSPPNGGSRLYKNSEFGITVPIPDRVGACIAPPEEHDHGPTLLLGGVAKSACNDLDQIERSRYIEVFAGYNAADDTKTLNLLLKSSCAGFASNKRCGPALSDLQIPGLRSATATVKSADGSIEVIVVTQAGRPDPAFDPSVPSVNYQITLHTGLVHLDTDLRVLREVLRTIRLSPPPPADLKSK